MPFTDLPPFTSLTDAAVRVKVVDIGANPIDAEPPYAPMLRRGEADVVGFEPNGQALATLEARKGPNETYLPHAVGDGGRHTLRICFAEGMTSLFEPNPEVLNLFHGFPMWGRVVERREVDTVRLDEVPETEGVDLLKMDIQGAELMVLQSGQRRLADALVVHAEVEFLPMYVGQPLFSDVESFLRQNGFMFHRFDPAAVSRPLQPMLMNNDVYTGISQLFWADALFVRDITRLERLSERQLLAMAAIMHDCYRSVDLVFRLLAEHDRRSGGALSSRYLERLQRGAGA